MVFQILISYMYSLIADKNTMVIHCFMDMTLRLMYIKVPWKYCHSSTFTGLIKLPEQKLERVIITIKRKLTVAVS